LIKKAKEERKIRKKKKVKIHSRMVKTSRVSVKNTWGKKYWLYQMKSKLKKPRFN